MTAQEQLTLASKNRSNSNALLGLTVACFVLSVLPMALLSSSITSIVLIFDIICLLLAITLLIQVKGVANFSRTKYVVSLVLSIFAIIVASAYLIIIPMVNNVIDTAACDLQTVVDPSECPSDYKINSNQELKQN